MTGVASGPRDWVSELLVTLTIFQNQNATKKRELVLSLPKLAELIKSTNAPKKEKLPWLKLASFGEFKSLKGSLRHDGNVKLIYGLEADYDGEKISFDEAHEILVKAGVLAILYTSPSHTEDSPRWRVLAFFSVPHDPDQRNKLMGRLNGLFNAEFSAESWALSQSYYFGPVNRNPSHRVEIIDGEPIDLLYDLDINWMGKPGVKPAVIVRNDTKAVRNNNQRHQLDEEAMLRDLMTGASFHGALVRLVGKWARERKPMMWVEQQLYDAFDRVPDDIKATPRWVSRREDIERCVDDIYLKEAAKRDEADARREARQARLAGAKPGSDPPADDDEKDVAAEYQALRDSLAKNENGGVYGTHANLALILAGDPRLQGIVRRNEFAASIALSRPMPSLAGHRPAPGPYPRDMTEEDTITLLAYCQKVWSRAFRRATVTESLLIAADEYRFHPVREWLDSLKWDGTPRLDDWLHSVFDCTSDAYHKAVGKNVLIAAVRRIRRPGCKFDYVMILEGPQGVRKSTALQTLFGEAWVTDDLHRDLTSKDAPIGMAGKWCIELAEIAHFLRTTPETLKAFISRAVDHYRPPWGSVARDVPRQSIMIGTTNSDDYLTDVSGNRRIWPVKCLLGPGFEMQFADLDWLKGNREQLWAEAAAREAAGEATWLVDDDTATRAATEQAARMGGDPWREAVLAYADMAAGPVQIPHILDETLKVPIGNQTKPMEMRVAAILRAEGWVRRQQRRRLTGGKPMRLWYRNEKAALDDTGEADDGRNDT